MPLGHFYALVLAHSGLNSGLGSSYAIFEQEIHFQIQYFRKKHFPALSYDLFVFSTNI